MKLAFFAFMFCVCSSCVCMDEWPSMPNDATPNHPEPKILANFHATRFELGYYCFMPKDQQDVDLLYRRYKNGKFLRSSRNKGNRNPVPGWELVLINMKGELGTRVTAGDMYFIDKYLEYIEIFIDLLDHHQDSGFVGNMFSYYALPHALIDSGVSMAYAMATNPVYKKSKERTLKTGERSLTESEALYITLRLNNTINKTGRCDRDILLEAYLAEKRVSINFFNSKNGSKMLATVRKMFVERGLPVNDIDELGRN